MTLRERAAASPIRYGLGAGVVGVVAALILVLLFGHLYADHLLVDTVRQNILQQQQQQQSARPPAPSPPPAKD